MVLNWLSLTEHSEHGFYQENQPNFGVCDCYSQKTVYMQLLERFFKNNLHTVGN